MGEILDKYTGLRFSSRQEYDNYGRTQEHHELKKKYIKKWSNTYRCYVCKQVFSTIEELNNHYIVEHPDFLYQLNIEGKKLRGAQW